MLQCNMAGPGDATAVVKIQQIYFAFVTIYRELTHAPCVIYL